MSKSETNRSAPRRLRVLIADDSAAIRNSLSSLIARVKNVEIVGLAETGAEALAMARSLKPDAMTLDIRMPEINGVKVLEAVRRENLEVTIIVLTGFVEDEYRRACRDLGATHFLHKASEFEQVIEILKDLADRQNPPGKSDPSAH